MEYVYTKIGHMEFFAPELGLSDSADNLEERLNIVEVGHSLPYPGKKVVRRTDCHHLHFITSGGGFIDGTEIPSGRGFYVEAGSIYSEEVGCGGLEQYWINFTGSDCAALLSRLGIDRDARFFDFSSEPGRIRAAFDEVFGRGERVQNEFSLLGLLFRTISYINRGAPPLGSGARILCLRGGGLYKASFFGATRNRPYRRRAWSVGKISQPALQLGAPKNADRLHHRNPHGGSKASAEIHERFDRFDCRRGRIFRSALFFQGFQALLRISAIRCKASRHHGLIRAN